MADLIQSNYEQLSAVAKRFETSSNQISAMRQQLNQRIGRLRQSWQGVGATAFLAEWERAVDPTIQRLAQALQHAGATTQQIHRIVSEAEQAAARLFQREPLAPSVPTTTPALPVSSNTNDAAPQIPQWLLDLLEVAVLGDFSDKMSLPGIIAQIVIGLFPGAGQIADLRDIVAGVVNVLQGDEFAGLFLVFAMVAIFPGMDALKAAKALKPILRALGNEGIQEIVEFIAKNPDQIGRVAQTLGGMLDNPKVIQAVADNPQMMMGLIRHGSPEGMELLVGLIHHGSPEAMEAIVKGGDQAIIDLTRIASKNGPEDAGYIVSEYHRFDELASEGSQGGKITDKTRREAEVGLAMEGRGELPPITRYEGPAAEFVDATKKEWDVKTFDSLVPGRFQLSTHVDDVMYEIVHANENIILDTKNLTSDAMVALRDAIEAACLERGLKMDEHVLWYPQKP